MTRGRAGAVRLAHVNLAARDGPGLAAFYKAVFGCEEIGGWRHLAGEIIGRGNGLPGCEIEALWLRLPGGAGPFLEIFQYWETVEQARPAVNAPGWGHLCFTVEDIGAARAAILAAGGAAQGETVALGPAGGEVFCAYMRDPEGNVLELEERRAGV